jgi:hypothetical protein
VRFEIFLDVTDGRFHKEIPVLLFTLQEVFFGPLDDGALRG